MSDNYKDKIRKLLALAGSDNENEAKAAMLKARELMAGHCIAEADLKEKPDVREVLTKYSCNSRREPWAMTLAQVIAQNYRCICYGMQYRGEKTSTIGFIGAEEDVEICIEIFDYAMQCVRPKVKAYKDDLKGYNRTQWARGVCDGYGYGFATGVKKAFDQQDEEGWGLIMKTPQEVRDYVAGGGFKDKSIDRNAADRINQQAARRGYNDGMQFDPSKKLSSAG